MFAKTNLYAQGILIVGVSLTALAGGPQVQAQESADTADNSNVQFEEIVVTGVRGSILSSLGQKRNAGGFVDAVSSEDLGKFPDLNISESLQRIPGVTLSRNDYGDGASINLRGLGPAFTRVEINGLTGPVNDAKGGGFNFEILASELFSGAKVNKSYSAHNVEGGLAGLVELRTPHAFDRDGFATSVSAQGQYAENADDLGPRSALLISQNWDDKVGITASFAYSKTSYFTSSNGGISARPLFAPATADLRASATQEQLDSLIPSTINYEINNDDRETIGGTLGLQYRPTENLLVTIDGIYGHIKGKRRFTRADAPPESGIYSIEDETIVDGIIQSATLSDVQNRVATNNNNIEENFYMLSGEVEWHPNDNWTITPFVGYSMRELSDEQQLLSFARGNPETGELARFPVSYSVNGQFIEFSSPGMDLSDPALAEEYYLNVFLVRPLTDKDEEISTKLDFQYDFDDSPISDIKFGGRYSDRELSSSAYRYQIDNDGNVDYRTLPSLADALLMENFEINGAPASFPSQIISADPEQVMGLYLLGGFDPTAYSTPREGEIIRENIYGLSIPGTKIVDRQDYTASNTFSGKEQTLAFYAEVSMAFDDFRFNGGLRYIDTKQTSIGFRVANGVSKLLKVSNSYSKLLPSMSLSYEVEPDLLLRAAYSQSLTRPTLFDLRVAETFAGIDESGGTGSRGNPELKPFTSDNFDIGLEWYFAEEGLVAMNAFYKSIDGLVVNTAEIVERDYLSQVTGELVTGPITFSLPANGDTANVKGVELILQSRFNFLPGSMSNFGGILTYTYAESNAAYVEGQDATEVATIPNISKNSFNAILYYDDGMFDARLSYAYRDRFVMTTAGSFGVPVFQNGRGQLDFSTNYSLTEQVSLQFQVLNLTKARLETESIRGLPHDTGQLDRRFFLGARYNF